MHWLSIYASSAVSYLALSVQVVGDSTQLSICQQAAQICACPAYIT